MTEQYARTAKAEIESKLKRAGKVAQEFSGAWVEKKIGSGLGKVRVNGYGVIKEVTIIPTAVGYMDGSTLGRKIVEAVVAAERDAAGIRSNNQ